MTGAETSAGRGRSEAVLWVWSDPARAFAACGGTLLRHLDAGDRVHGLLMEEGWLESPVLEALREGGGLASIDEIPLTREDLRRRPLRDLTLRVGEVVRRRRPAVVYLPWRSRREPGARRSFEAALACTKWFRYPSVRRVLAFAEGRDGLRPNVFSSLDDVLDRKLEILLRRLPAGLAEPRGEELRRAAAACGERAGVAWAEGYRLLKERS